MSECNIDKREVVDELNDLLKGTYMGRYCFQNLVDRTSRKDVNDLLLEMIDILNNHVKIISNQIIECEGIPHDDHTLAIAMSDMMVAMKNSSLNTKEELLNSCIKDIGMGQEAVNKMICKYGDKPVCLNKDYKDMVSDIKEIM
ncbi:MAG: DUF2383 domain-containing protein [Erysipelotrichaceae bacterium]